MTGDRFGEFGPLTPDHVRRANDEGSNVVVYHGYAVTVSAESLQSGLVSLAAMARQHRRKILADVQRTLDAFMAKYPAEDQTDASAIPAGELANFRNDVAIYFAEMIRTGEAERYRADHLFKVN